MVLIPHVVLCAVLFLQVGRRLRTQLVAVWHCGSSSSSVRLAPSHWHDSDCMCCVLCWSCRLAYSKWMYEWVQRLDPKASDEELILARGR